MNDEGMTPDDILHLARGLRVDATPGFTRDVMTRKIGRASCRERVWIPV